MRNRQRRFALFLVFLLLAVSLASCSRMDEVLGRWEIRIDDEDLGSVMIIYRFTEEGEIYLEQQQGDEIPFSLYFGSFSVDGDYLTIQAEGERQQYLFTVTDTTLILAAEGEEDLVFWRV